LALNDDEKNQLKTELNSCIEGLNKQRK